MVKTVKPRKKRTVVVVVVAVMVMMVDHEAMPEKVKHLAW